MVKRGENYDISEELNEMIKKRDLKRENQDSSDFKWILKRMFSMNFFKPYAGAGLGYIMNALSGSDVLIVYMISILKDTGLFSIKY